MTRSDAELVADALDHLAILRRHLARGDIADDVIADAVCLRLAAAIESVASSSPDFRTRAFGDDWHVIWATRNRIAHGYAYIDIDIIRATVDQDLPDFEQALRAEATRQRWAEVLSHSQGAGNPNITREDVIRAIREGHGETY